MALERKREEPHKLTELLDEEDSIVDARSEAEREAEIGLSPEAKRELNVVDASNEDEHAPAQLGSKRFVYAAYFAGAIGVTFFFEKGLNAAWLRLALWKPMLGEPNAMGLMLVSAVVGAATALYFYRDVRTRTLAEEVASELGKVTWPNKEEVTNGTVVVIITTLLATVFFALMDRFWGFVTNLVYGT
ncbi:MAG: preprotein translocase subunit SecE [Polyangiaceae bacterium]